MDFLGGFELENPDLTEHSLTGDLSNNIYASSPNSLYMYEQEKVDMQTSLVPNAMSDVRFGMLMNDDFDLKSQYETSTDLGKEEMDPLDCNDPTLASCALLTHSEENSLIGSLQDFNSEKSKPFANLDYLQTSVSKPCNNPSTFPTVKMEYTESKIPTTGNTWGLQNLDRTMGQRCPVSKIETESSQGMGQFVPSISPSLPRKQSVHSPSLTTLLTTSMSGASPKLHSPASQTVQSTASDFGINLKWEEVKNDIFVRDNEAKAMQPQTTSMQPQTTSRIKTKRESIGMLQECITI